MSDTAIIRMRRRMLDSVRAFEERDAVPLALAEPFDYGDVVAAEGMLPLDAPWQDLLARANAGVADAASTAATFSKLAALAALGAAVCITGHRSGPDDLHTCACSRCRPTARNRCCTRRRPDLFRKRGIDADIVADGKRRGDLCRGHRRFGRFRLGQSVAGVSKRTRTAYRCASSRRLALRAATIPTGFCWCEKIRTDQSAARSQRQDPRRRRRQATSPSWRRARGSTSTAADGKSLTFGRAETNRTAGRARRRPHRCGDAQTAVFDRRAGNRKISRARHAVRRDRAALSRSRAGSRPQTTSRRTPTSSRVSSRACSRPRTIRMRIKPPPPIW